MVFKGSHRSTMLISWDTCGPDAVPLPPDGMAKDTVRLVYPRLHAPCASNTSICLLCVSKALNVYLITQATGFQVVLVKI